MSNQAKHQPVLLTETLEHLQVKPDKWYLDGTFGRGGHTRQILAKGGRVVALDVDQAAIEYGQDEFQAEIKTEQLVLIRENFDKLHEVVIEHSPVQQFTGMLFDFGTSVDQLTDDQRGFSFDADAPLDMRMDTRLGVTAYDLLNVLSEKQLAQLFIEFGGEHEAKNLAHKLAQLREHNQLPQTTAELAQVISRAKRQTTKLHPATKVFQALRIAVNSELAVIEQLLPQVLEHLEPGGRLVTIAFHEGEDRPVKQTFRDWKAAGLGQVLTKKPVTPTEIEVQNNPRARSAKLRAFVKIT